MDLATLGLAVDSREVVDASKDLDRIREAAARAERAADSFGVRMEASGKRAAAANDNVARSAERATKAYGDYSRAAKLAARAVGMVASALGVAFGGAAFVTGMLNAVNRMEAIEVASRKIDKALQNNGYTADLTTKKIIDFAKALEQRTGRAMQDVLDIAPNLASFQFTEQVALRSIALADDMAAAWGGDLKQNFEGLGRALADPVKGFAMLSQRGITLDDTQKKLVKSLMQTGQGLKAQEVVLEALEAQIKGVAEAGYTPLARAQDGARKSIEAFFEKLVSSQGAGDSLIKILNGLADAMTFLGDNIGTIVTGLEIFAAAHIVGGIMSIVGAIQTMTATMELATVAARALSIAMAFTGGPAGLAVIALGAAYLLLRDNVSEAQQAATNANNAFHTNAKAMKVAEGASGEYSQALRDQIAMQIEVARASVTSAQATWESALATRDAFRAMTGLKFAPLEYNEDVAFKQVNALDFALGRLEDQLKKVDANLAKATTTDRNFGSEASDRAKKAYEDLMIAAKGRVDQMKLEAETAGLTGIAQDALRFRLELLQKVEEKRLKLSPKQRDALLANVDAYEKYAAAAAKATLQQDLLFEREQMFRSAAEQRIAGALRSAGLPVDLDSEIAKAIRFNIELERMKDTWQSVFDTANNGVDTLVDALFDGTMNIGEALKQIGRDFARMMFDLSVTNPFKNWLTGADLPSIADLGIFGSGASSGKGGGFGGVLGGLLGAQKAVASMQVQAASVIVNGSVLGGAGGIGAGLPNILGGTAANDNFLPPKSLSGIGSPADPVSLASGLLGFNETRDAAAINNYLRAGGVNLDAASQAWCAAFVNSSLKQIGVGGSGSNVATSFLNWGKSVNPADVLRGDVLVQSGGLSAGQVGGHVGFATGRTRMSEDNLQLQMLSGNTSDKVGLDWYNASDISARRALPGASTSASEALDKLAASSMDSAGSLASGLGSLTGVTQSTMQALEQFGIGAGNLGSMLQNLMATGGGFGGNWFANLAGMFGGAGGALNHMNAISPMATAHILKGGVGLFDRGGYTGDGGKHDFAGLAHKGEFYFSKEATANIGVDYLSTLHEAGKRGAGFAEGGFASSGGPLRGIAPLRRGNDGLRGASAGTSEGQQNRGMSDAQIEKIVAAFGKKLSFNVKNVNVSDPSVVGDYLNTDEGERLIMNVIRRNRAA